MQISTDTIKEMFYLAVMQRKDKGETLGTAFKKIKVNATSYPSYNLDVFNNLQDLKEWIRTNRC
jgi:hypothetical protein